MSAESSIADKMAACAEMAKPAPEHALLKAFEGRFKARVTMWWDPSADPMVSTGVMTNRLVLGDKFIEHDYADDTGMFHGKGFWGFNTLDKRWEGVWIDSMASFMHTDTGSYDQGARTWEMRGQMTDPSSGDTLYRRNTITLSDDDHHTMESFFAREPGGAEFRSMLIEYTRA